MVYMTKEEKQEVQKYVFLTADEDGMGYTLTHVGYMTWSEAVAYWESLSLEQRVQTSICTPVSIGMG
jgi:hypothetical protein